MLQYRVSTSATQILLFPIYLFNLLVQNVDTLACVGMGFAPLEPIYQK